MNKRLLQIIGSVLLFIPTFFLSEGWLQLAFYTGSYLLAGGSVIWKAVSSMRPGSLFDESFLMSIATLGAFYIGEYPEGIAVMVFYQIGEYFQDYAVGKSRRSIKSLLQLKPDIVNQKIGDEIKVVDPEKVETGSLIVVRPGERVPLDGVVEEGSSTLDTSALTGEALPEDIEPGDRVMSGSVNQGGLLHIRTTGSYGDSTVKRILELVENASGKKSVREQFITRFAIYYTPFVVVAGLALAFIPPFLLGMGDFDTWLYRALAFLVVSCPCALVVSIPLTFFAGIGAASREGILVKGGNYLEALADTDAVVFDKTGTLTKGVFEVVAVEAEEGFTINEVLELAAHSEAHSAHPISDSLKRAYGAELEDKRISDLKEVAGKGLVAYVDGRRIAAGNAKLMADEGIEVVGKSEYGSTVYLGVEGKYAGYINIADQAKADSALAVAELIRMGVKKITMLTGDTMASAGKIAEELKITDYRAELLPGDKLKALEELMTDKRGKGRTVFAGDGINDAPVLARSDIGIAMGGLGRDAAIEAADVVIMQDEPMKIIKAIRLGKRIKGIASANIVMALSIKAVVLLLSATGQASLWMAVFADVGVTILAVMNSLRALKRKEY